MQSSELLLEGFQAWQRFHPDSKSALLASLPLSLGVFAVRRRQPYQLSVGESDIAYVGYGTNKKGLRRRVRQCFRPGFSLGRPQSTNIKILEAIKGPGAFELSWLECANACEARRLVKDLLQRYRNEHGQLPPLRKRMSACSRAH